MPIDHRVAAIPSSADKPGSGMPPHRIGCAGWSILSGHAALFGEGDSHLARYATRFNAVEINSSFYRPHAATTYARWAASVPRSFHFSVKLKGHHPRRRTARRRATPRRDSRTRSPACGQRLGGVLVQLPPSLAFDRAHGRRLLRDAAATDRGAGGVRSAARRLSLEPRQSMPSGRATTSRASPRIPRGSRRPRGREARDAGPTGAGTALRACTTTATTRNAVMRGLAMVLRAATRAEARAVVPSSTSTAAGRAVANAAATPAGVVGAAGSLDELGASGARRVAATPLASRSSSGRRCPWPRPGRSAPHAPGCPQAPG